MDALSTALLWRFIAELENSPAALPEPIEAARLFIHQLLSEELTLSAIASAANVTPAYLVRLFREHMGTTGWRPQSSAGPTGGIVHSRQ